MCDCREGLTLRPSTGKLSRLGRNFVASDTLVAMRLAYTLGALVITAYAALAMSWTSANHTTQQATIELQRVQATAYKRKTLDEEAKIKNQASLSADQLEYNKAFEEANAKMAKGADATLETDRMKQAADKMKAERMVKRAFDTIDDLGGDPVIEQTEKRAAMKMHAVSSATQVKARDVRLCCWLTAGMLILTITFKLFGTGWSALSGS